MPDLYELLGCSRQATTDQIIAEYRVRVVSVHPDKFPDQDRKGAQEKFNELQYAKEILCDPSKRRHYDAYLALGSAMPLQEWMENQEKLQQTMHWAANNSSPQMIEPSSKSNPANNRFEGWTRHESPTISAFLLAQFNGYAAYGGGSSNSEQTSSGSALAPAAPMAPPRVPLPSEGVSSPSGSSLGYRPPPPPLRRDEKSIGQCSFDSSKWQVEPQSAIAHAIMFDRTTGLSCEECLDKCTQFQDASSQWVCRTLTYDHRWKICDLFAVNGTERPFFLAQYHGRDYFVYLAALPPTDAELIGGNEVGANTNSVASGSAPSVPATSESAASGSVASESAASESATSGSAASEPATSKSTASESATSGSAPASPTAAPSGGVSVSSEYTASHPAPAPAAPGTNSAVHRNNVLKSGQNTCGHDEVTRYLQFESSERSNPGEEVEFSPAKTREECVDACNKEQIFSCSSAVYSPAGCELSVSVANHSESDSLRTSSTAIYLEKTCLPQNLVKSTRTIFPAVKNFVMVGHVQEVADANTLAECQVACLRAEKDYGFICKSAMWYPGDATQNCLLNSQSHTTRPEVFTNEDQGVNMVYFEIVYEDSEFKNNGLNNRFRDTPLSDAPEGKWTKWSKCKDMSGMRHRYLKCTDKKDIRKCPKESVMCRHLPALQIQKLTSECRAVQDSQGRKRCPHGIRTTKSGRKEYCAKPVDC
ncbi:hypothetical protein FO519_000625 [Halicephalobus sp. NKZ332]|nr:hypothetical protein FO519_000625 [Halicephalobus sp. NKZ332]